MLSVCTCWISATDLVITFGHGVHRFTLDPSLGEFIHIMVGRQAGGRTPPLRLTPLHALTSRDLLTRLLWVGVRCCRRQGHIQMPSVPKTIYSCNEGNYSLWDEAIRGAVRPPPPTTPSDTHTDRPGSCGPACAPDPYGPRSRSTAGVAGGLVQEPQAVALLGALRGVDGVGRAPHPALRRRLPVPGRQEVQEGQAARAVRGLPHGQDHRGRGRSGLHRALQRLHPEVGAWAGRHGYSGDRRPLDRPSRPR